MLFFNINCPEIPDLWLCILMANVNWSDGERQKKHVLQDTHARNIQEIPDQSRDLKWEGLIPEMCGLKKGTVKEGKKCFQVDDRRIRRQTETDWPIKQTYRDRSLHYTDRLAWQGLRQWAPSAYYWVFMPPVSLHHQCPPDCLQLTHADTHMCTGTHTSLTSQAELERAHIHTRALLSVTRQRIMSHVGSEPHVRVSACECVWKRERQRVCIHVCVCE